MMKLRDKAFKPPFLYRNAHFATVACNRLRRLPKVPYKRTTIHTSDGDFFDADISSVGGSYAVVVLHGLEGSSHSGFVKSMVAIANAEGFDAIAMNQRSCSGRPNKLFSSYHSGKTDDLLALFRHFDATYKGFFLIGFSLGGNIALKFAGEDAGLTEKLLAVAGVSVPCDLSASSMQLEKPQNFVYKKLFLDSLVAKVVGKLDLFAEHQSLLRELKKIRTIRDFDDLYTAPFHGFASAEDYYQKNSSKRFVHKIKVPALLINAQNDPFLAPSCHPVEECGKNPKMTLHLPFFGGHIGFASDVFMQRPFWHEQIFISFIHSIVNGWGSCA